MYIDTHVKKVGLKNGVKQDGGLSPILFAVYTDGLLNNYRILM